MNCPRCGAMDCNDPDSKACSDNCITRLQRELAAYQNAEMPKANHAELVKHMREESFDCPLCAQAAEYIDAVALRCARLTGELGAERKDAERHGFSMRHVSYYSMQGRFLVDCEHESMPGSDASMDYENSIDTALAAGKEKAE